MSFFVRSTRVKVSFSFFAMLTLAFLADGGYVTFIMLASVLLHESGHIFGMLALNYSPQEVSFGVFGIRIRQGGMSYSGECIVALCGPLVNVVLGAIGFFVFSVLRSEFAFSVGTVNASLAVFNLIPIYPLDGGTALKSFLSGRFLQETVGRIMTALSVVLICVLFAAGVLLLIETGDNPSMLFTSVYLAVLAIKGIRM